jgi:hypothetical protein
VIETSAFSIIQSKHDTREAELRVTSSRKSEDVSSLVVVLLVRAAVGSGPIPWLTSWLNTRPDAESILSRILSADQSLGLLQHRLGFRVPIESFADDLLHRDYFAVSKFCEFAFASFPAERPIVLANVQNEVLRHAIRHFDSVHDAS